MIRLTPIPTPKNLYKNLFRLVRSLCSRYEIEKDNPINLPNIPPITDPTPIIKAISEVIYEFTHYCIPNCYSPTFSKQLRRYFYTYRHMRIVGVSPH